MIFDVYQVKTGALALCGSVNAEDPETAIRATLAVPEAAIVSDGTTFAAVPRDQVTFCQVTVERSLSLAPLDDA